MRTQNPGQTRNHSWKDTDAYTVLQRIRASRETMGTHRTRGPHGKKQSLPLTVSVADVFSCPHTHEYSPASATARPRISSSHTIPSCLKLTLSPALRISGPFPHSTGAALLSSHCSVAVAPSVASSFLRPLVNLAGRAGQSQGSGRHQTVLGILCPG